jgi:hypothetical protein
MEREGSLQLSQKPATGPILPDEPNPRPHPISLTSYVISPSHLQGRLIPSNSAAKKKVCEFLISPRMLHAPPI